MSELDSDPVYPDLSVSRYGLEKLWNSNMAEDAYAKFVETLPIF
jgi:hypothetical protein